MVESCDIRFLIGIVGTVARDGCFAGVAIKCRTHHSRVGFLSAEKHCYISNGGIGEVFLGKCPPITGVIIFYF